MLFDYFQNGVNLGGWFSQYECILDAADLNARRKEEHFRHFITEQNIAQIASWGMDHVRLPVDYRFLAEGSSAVGAKAFSCLDACADLCEKYHLNLIIDLHNAEGNLYGAMDEPMPLLTEEPLKQRFLNIWKSMAAHFKGRTGPVVMFELLNEVSDASGGYLWSGLYRRAIQTIRTEDPDRFILVGSNRQNDADCLDQLELVDDDRVFYNFHFYDPMVFTHQKAHFSEEMVAYGRATHYPGEINGFTDFLLRSRQYIPKYRKTAMETENDRALMLRLLKGALNFVAYSGRELYCGEFGVIGSAQPDDAARWLRDCTKILDSRRIGHALWNYKALDFGLVDMENKVVSKERLNAVL